MDLPPFSRPSELPSTARHCDEALHSRLSLAREYINDCFDQPLDLQQISRQAFFSPFHFLRLFRRAFQKTPHQYLIEQRLEKAKELLAASELSVTAICFTVGFQSLGSFSSLFHKHVGHPPSVYRQQMYPRFHVAAPGKTIRH